MTKLDATLTMLKELTDARGIPGNEREPREVMDRYIRPYADEVVQDNLGSLIAKKTGDINGPKIMVSGHLDEVGFMVTRIDDDGFIYFQTVGGWWSQVMSAQRVTIMTSKGDVNGVFGSIPPPILSPEDSKKPLEIKDMFIDIGALNKEEAEAAGVTPGDSIVPDSKFAQLTNKKMLMAKAWDNRIGCAIAIDVLKELKGERHPNIVYGVGTVQEELGLRGAKTASHLIKPDIGISVDVGFAGDTPGVSKKYTDAKLGKGPEIIIFDASMVAHRGVRDFIVDIANEHDIPFQYSAVPGGGTDAGEIHLSVDGVPSLAITIPTRYMHTHATILHRDDFENAVKLIVQAIKKLDNNKVKEIRLA